MTEKANKVLQTFNSPTQHKEMAKNMLLSMFQSIDYTLRPFIEFTLPEFIIKPSRETQVNIYKQKDEAARHLPFNDGYVSILEKPSKIYITSEIKPPRGIFPGTESMVLPFDDSLYLVFYYADNVLLDIVPSSKEPFEKNNNWECLRKKELVFKGAFFIKPGGIRVNFMNRLHGLVSYGIDLVTQTEEKFNCIVENYCVGGLAVQKHQDRVYRYVKRDVFIYCSVDNILESRRKVYEVAHQRQPKHESIRCSPYFSTMLLHVNLELDHNLYLLTFLGTDRDSQFSSHNLGFVKDASKSHFVLAHKKVVEISTLPGKFITVYEIVESVEGFKVQVLYVVPAAPVPIDHEKDQIKQAFFGYEGRLIIIMNTCTIVY
jgi:hypothetical protein